jgi:hypothetical protein
MLVPIQGMFITLSWQKFLQDRLSLLLCIL